jgi:hypothetical protein
MVHKPRTPHMWIDIFLVVCVSAHAFILWKETMTHILDTKIHWDSWSTKHSTTPRPPVKQTNRPIVYIDVHIYPNKYSIYFAIYRHVPKPIVINSDYQDSPGTSHHPVLEHYFSNTFQRRNNIFLSQKLASAATSAKFQRNEQIPHHANS